MRLHHRLIIGTGALIMLSTMPALPAWSAAHHYRTIDLGTLGGDGSTALAVNGSGHATGQSADSKGAQRPFLYRNGKMLDVGVLDPAVPYGVGLDVNNHDWVVGGSDVAGGTAMHAFLWRDGHLTDLGTLGGGFSVANAVNDKGQVVGESSTSSGQVHAFLWQDGHMTDLGLSNAKDINNRGQVTGGTVVGANFHAYRWQHGKVKDLGDLGNGVSQGAKVNIHGIVVGSGNAAGFGHAFIWRNGKMTDLGTLGGGSSDAVAINDHGYVLGASDTGTALHGFLWHNGVLADLTTRGIPADAGVRDINNSGQIAGSFYPTPGHPHAALFV
jgi:probable HAF family extracellular repeat protein